MGTYVIRDGVSSTRCLPGGDLLSFPVSTQRVRFRREQFFFCEANDSLANRYLGRTESFTKGSGAKTKGRRGETQGRGTQESCRAKIRGGHVGRKEGEREASRCCDHTNATHSKRISRQSFHAHSKQPV